MPAPTNITSIVPFFTDKGKSQVDSFTNSGTLIRRDARTTLTVRTNYTFGLDSAGNPLGTAEAVGDYIGIIRLKDGADINWHNAEILVDDDAADFTCELGLLDEDGTFTAKATMGVAVDNVSVAVVPGPDEAILTEPKWVVAKILDGGTPDVPASGKAAFYITYIALA